MHVHDTSELLFRLCANTDPQRDIIFIPPPRNFLFSVRRTVRVLVFL